MKYYLVEIKNPLFPKPSYHNWGELSKEDFDKKIEYWSYPNNILKILKFDSETEMSQKKFEIINNGMQIYSIV
jgi:hypothetical protein